MITQVEERAQINQHYPIVSLEPGGMIGVTAPVYATTSVALRPLQGRLTASIVCLGLGMTLGAIGYSVLISNEIAKVQADAKIQISKAQDTAAIAQWNNLKKQQQIDDFCSKNGSPKNGKNNQENYH